MKGMVDELKSRMKRLDDFIWEYGPLVIMGYILTCGALAVIAFIMMLVVLRS